MTTDTITPEASAPPLAITEYSPVAAGLADLRARHEGVVYDLTTTAGDKAARAARRELVTLRTTLEDTRKALKAPALERSRLIDAEAKRIEAAIRELEDPLDAQIRADEERREAFRQAKAEAERQRVQALQRRVSALAAFPVRAMGEPSPTIADLIAELSAITVDAGSFEEMAGEAVLAKESALMRLRAAYDAAVTQEAEIARLALEREELARQQAELKRQQEAADRRQREQEAAARAEREAEEARQRAEREAHEAAMRAEREAAEAALAEQRRAEAERQAEADRIAREAREAEECRIAAERAELERQQAALASERAAAEAKARAEAEAAEQARIAAEKAQRDAEQAADRRLRDHAQQLGDALAMCVDVMTNADAENDTPTGVTNEEWDVALATGRRALVDAGLLVEA